MVQTISTNETSRANGLVYYGKIMTAVFERTKALDNVKSFFYAESSGLRMRSAPVT